MKEHTDLPELDSEGKRCEACGEAAYEKPYGFWICNACRNFLHHSFKSNPIHKPCGKDKQCIITSTTLKECPCCFLRKCVSLKMDPYYETRRKISRLEIPQIQELRKSFPYHPCPTCTSNISPVSEELNREDCNTSSDGSLQIISKVNKDNLTVSLLQRYPPCKVCGDNVRGPHYSVFICHPCFGFFQREVKSKTAHRQCPNNKQCIITDKTRSRCDCCRLRKCLAVGMDPYKVTTKVVIKYKSFRDCEPIEWFVLLSCETCNVKEIGFINEYIQKLKYFFEYAKGNGSISITMSIKEVEDSIKVPSVEKSDVSSSGSHLEVRNDFRPDISSTYSLSSSRLRYVDLVNIAWQ